VKMNFRDWPEEVVQQFRDLWNDGLTVREIKDAMPISADTILNARRYYHLPTRHAGRPHRRPKAKAAPLAVLPCPDEPGWPTKAQLMGGR
jgi:hypothetical protein